MTDQTVFMPFLHSHDMRLAIDLDAADEREAVQKSAEEVAHAHALAEDQARLAADEAREAIRSQEPPDDIAVDPALSPMRDRLCRYVKWIAALEAEHATLTAGREKYLADQGVPALTEAAIRKLVADDKSGLLAMMGGAVSKHQLRGAERARLTEKLKSDQHAAEIAVSAIEAADARLDQLTVEIEALKARHPSFVADALSELCAERDASKLIDQANALQSTEVRIMGATAAIAQLKREHHQPRHQSVQLPLPPFAVAGISGHVRPGFAIAHVPTGHAMEFSLHDQNAAKARWLEVAKLLTDNPHAEIGDI